ncbi:MAG: GNAT family protein [Parvularculales bacterium]
MAVLWSGLWRQETRRIEGRRVYLRAPQWLDYEAWATLRSESREFLTPWEPSWAVDELSKSGYRRRLAAYERSAREEEGYPWFIFRQHDNALVGGITLSSIRRGAQQSGVLGYWAGQVYAGRGYVADAVRATLAFSFNTLGLYRIEAACLPENEASKWVLRRCGFTEEGYARLYLQIAGVRRDHLLFAILCHDGIKN